MIRSSAKIRQLLLAVFILGLFLFNQPILGIFNEPKTILGVPAILFYVFLVWALLILLIVLITLMFKSKAKNN